MNYEAIIEKFRVRHESTPDYLGLMGDTADGFRVYGDGERNHLQRCPGCLQPHRARPQRF